MGDRQENNTKMAQQMINIKEDDIHVHEEIL